MLYQFSSKGVIVVNCKSSGNEVVLFVRHFEFCNHCSTLIPRRLLLSQNHHLNLGGNKGRQNVNKFVN